MTEPSFTTGKDASFRQTGVRPGGKLVRGNAHLHSQPTISSIPAKFETVLFTGATEADAFHSRTQRFKRTESDLPGPGAYDLPSPTAHRPESISKKGYGNGFVSRETRFTPAPAGPGPGRYSRADPLIVKHKQDFNTTHGSSVFKTHTHGALVPTQHITPGPGAYRPVSPKNAPLKHRQNAFLHVEKHQPVFNLPDEAPPAELPPASSSTLSSAQLQSRILSQMADPPFMSTDTRFKSSANFVPPPGAYTPDIVSSDPSLSSSSALPSASSSLPSAPFRSTVPKSTFLVNVEKHASSIPPVGYYQVEEHKQPIKQDAASHIFKQGLTDRFGVPYGKRNSAEEIPGPGFYPSAPGFADPSPSKLKPSASFILPAATSSSSLSSPLDSLDQLQTQTADNINNKNKNRQVKSAGVVMTSDVRPPGPAYYNPSLPPKRSFHLNAKHKWL